MIKSFRPTAIPLIAADPFFSVWSFADRLTDDTPRHWTGRSQSMVGVLTVDGKPYRFMGLPSLSEAYVPAGNALRQTNVTVTPTSTVYTFSHPAATLKVTFLSPLLCDRPEILSRPVTYISYEIRPKESGHAFEVYFDASVHLIGDERGQTVQMNQAAGHAWMGNAEQRPLHASGDDVRIDWGYLHLVHENAKVGVAPHRYRLFQKRVSERLLARDLTAEPVAYTDYPILYARSEKLADTFVIAYDDGKAVEYFKEPIDAYYKTVYGDFGAMLAAAVREEAEVRKLAAAFDRKLTGMMKRVSPAYAAVGALAYRQVIAAHKLVSVNGKLLFLSKENFSNGCMATLDVTYPSIPLFLLLNPELVRGMMRPIFDYARRPVWPYPFAPHDCGRYPLCNGQVYSCKKDENGDYIPYEEHQMPVEECGNAILAVAAATAADGNRAMAEENADLLEQWADYLVEYGYDPTNQLCTDDFAGHLAHNCNLSVKAIVALGAYSRLFGKPAYMEAAKRMAARWVKEAKRSGGGYRLTFDQDDTWSMKYNMVWDRLLRLGLFGESVAREEIALYRQKMNRYGLPLDSRADYTKLDWMVWTTMMADDPEYTNEVFDSILRMMRDSADRVPLTDWYDTADARKVGFQARSVLGGFYINLLAGKFQETPRGIAQNIKM